MKLERVWLEELAEQYEEWATHPPMDEGRNEMFTCFALDDGDWGFPKSETTGLLCGIWKEDYGDTALPAGNIYLEQRCDAYGNYWLAVKDPERDDRRFEFCHYMADRLRELGEELYDE